MTLAEETVAVMAEAGAEIECLRRVNAELLAAAIYAVDQLCEGEDPDLDADGDEIDPFERLRDAIRKAQP